MSNSKRITDSGPEYEKFGAFDLPRRRGAATVLPAVLADLMTLM